MPWVDARDYLDLERYPIDDGDTLEYQQLIDRIRVDLSRDGCAVLPGFVRGERVGELIAEADRVAPFAHRSFCRTNINFTEDDPSLPEGHPRRRFYDRSNGFIPADHFGPDSILRGIYEWSRFPAFIQAALNEEHFHRYADPLADVIINMVEEGEGFPWHYDTNNYTVTLAIQNGLEGGAFEYSPNLRTPEDENDEGVAEVLDGTGAGVKTLHLMPGDLQIFRGRYSLHRVTPVVGGRNRYVAIFSYVEEPGMVGSPERTRQLYGRVLPIHREREGLRADRLID